MTYKPKKKGLEAEIKTALGITMESDLMQLEELREFPDLLNEPPRNQVIMAATALGIGQNYIAQALGVSQPTINEIINRIDPERRMRASKSAKRAFITKLYESRAIEAIGSITFDEIQQLSALEKGRLGKLCSEAAQNLNQSKHRESGGSKLDRLIQQVEAEASGAPYEEVENACIEE